MDARHLLHQHCPVTREPVCDPVTGEVFARVVGRRSRPSIGEPPTLEAQRAHASMLQYRTRAPKGIFIYRTPEAMDADRLRWTVEAMVESARGD